MLDPDRCVILEFNQLRAREGLPETTFSQTPSIDHLLIGVGGPKGPLWVYLFGSELVVGPCGVKLALYFAFLVFEKQKS